MIDNLPIERLLDLPYAASDEGNVESKISEKDIEAEIQGEGESFGPHRQGLEPGFGHEQVRKNRQSSQGLGPGKISRLAHMVNQLSPDGDGADNGDEVFSLLSSISLSEARKYRRGKRQKIEAAHIQYRVLLVDDR